MSIYLKQVCDSGTGRDKFPKKNRDRETSRSRFSRDFPGLNVNFSRIFPSRSSRSIQFRENPLGIPGTKFEKYEAFFFFFLKKK